METKKKLRQKVLSLRNSLSEGQRDKAHRQIAARVYRTEAYQQAQAILTYVNYQSEVATKEMIEQAIADGKLVFAPRVEDREMEFYQIHALDDLQSGYRDILEPATEKAFFDWLSDYSDSNGCSLPQIMMWMPGAVFDRNHHRIGYGGGFYDRYLERIEKWIARHSVTANTDDLLTTMALAYDCQIVENVPQEAHDRQPDFLITESDCHRLS